MSNTEAPPRVRIAPSPTGDPHVGTAYIAMFNYAFAKQRGGQFVLRIEDTDRARSSQQSEDAILDALRWLGIEWDEGPDKGGDKGPYRQSERLDLYRDYVDELVREGNAYWCSCTPERLAEVREKQREAKTTYGYDGRCRERDPAEVKREIDDGAPGVVRLKTPRDGETSFTDKLRGEISIPNLEVDDQVLLKHDGFPTYHLANVVDDKLMGITHVIRGEEWISSTPKHVLLYRAFGWDMPEFVHLPLLRNADKSKVSKRKNPVSLSYFREAGYLPDAMVNFLGMMAFTFEDGREVFSLEDFVRGFTLDRISLGGPVFDMDKLLWLNGRYLREQRDDEEFVRYLKEQLFSDDYLLKIVPLIKERVEKSEDFVSYAPYFFSGTVLTGDDQQDAFILDSMVPKDWKKKDAGKLWDELAERLDRLLDFTNTNIDALLRDMCEDKGLKPKQFFMPVRLMITGKKATPPLFETMSVLGRERCRYRVRQAVKALKAYNPKK